MDSQAFFERHGPLLKQLLLPIILSLAGLIFLGYGLISFLSSPSTEEEVIFETAENKDSQQAIELITDLETIVVDVSGAVEMPGVYTLSQDARVKDAVVAAGGFHTEADSEEIAKSINLAAKLTDGMKLYIPFEGEVVTQAVAQTSINTVSNTGFINVNTASEKELETLPGIGPVTAGKITSGRPYASIDELLVKKVVTQKVYDQIKDRVSVN